MSMLEFHNKSIQSNIYLFSLCIIQHLSIKYETSINLLYNIFNCTQTTKRTNRHNKYKRKCPKCFS